MSTGSVGGEGTLPRRIQAWIYLIDNNGRIVNQVQVSWPKVRVIYLKAKAKMMEKD